MAYSEIARQLHISGGTVHSRMGRLEDLGVVRGATLDLDLAKVGFTIQAFLGIYSAEEAPTATPLSSPAARDTRG